jgi:hypothetical protein
MTITRLIFTCTIVLAFYFAFTISVEVVEADSPTSACPDADAACSAIEARGKRRVSCTQVDGTYYLNYSTQATLDWLEFLGRHADILDALCCSGGEAVHEAVGDRAIGWTPCPEPKENK